MVDLELSIRRQSGAFPGGQFTRFEEVFCRLPQLRPQSGQVAETGPAAIRAVLRLHESTFGLGTARIVG